MSVAEAWSITRRLVRAPGATLDQIAAYPSPRAALIAVAGTGAAWSMLSALLWAGGHAPSRVLLPVPREIYYLAQAAFVIPILLTCYCVLAVVGHTLAVRLGGSGARRTTFACLGFAYALPLLFCLVVPDLVVYGLWGFPALKSVVRITGAVLFVSEWLLVARAVTAAHRLSGARSAVIAFAALLAQAVLGAAVLR
ncbi:MAG: hypothetical protein IPI67_09610 [Myxococcales bacterium]|nr:hypothetical protein [Myxococcales bacterium]